MYTNVNNKTFYHVGFFSRLINYILIIITLFINDVFPDHMDYNACKLSPMGLEYMGDISKSETGLRCQSWSMKNPINTMDPSYTDDKFPERSKEKAKNYCRNPSLDPMGPWCYTIDKNLINDTCGIPLCANIDCKVTGIGMDYAGKNPKSVSGKSCLSWDKHRKKVRKLQQKFETYEQKKFSKWGFPDESRGSAKKFCRNPDGDIAGPWCFVESDSEQSSGIVEKEYCNIPLCDDQICMVLTKNYSAYNHYTKFNESLTNLTFSIKLWDPDSTFEAHARLLLTLVPLPLNPDDINEMKIGIEIYISNKNSALRIGNKHAVDYEPSLNVLKSYEFTTFSLMWDFGFVTLNIEGQKEPIFLAEYKHNEDLFSIHKNSFLYYSLQGTNVFWALPLCDEDNECETHITTGDNFERFWPLRQTTVGHDLVFYLRAMHSTTILLQIMPTIEFPRLMLRLSHSNKTKLVAQRYKDSSEFVLYELDTPKLLNMWKWQEFSLAFFGQSVQLYWQRDVGKHILFEVQNKIIGLVRWFSPGSQDCLAFWTFYCSSPENEKEEYSAWPPECVLNHNENGYNGTQWMSSEGHPCAPWINDEDVVDKKGKQYALDNWNYCRDPLNEKKGAYCNAVSKTGTFKAKCGIRMCRSAECRMAGTGNDYIGTLNVTRSNRTCQKWTANTPHQINENYLNGSLFADQDVELANNYCRDPNRNISGPWCYTTDVAVPFDLCNVRDCTKREECTIMTRGNGIGRGIYILPQWKERGIHGGLYFSLKEWNPTLLDGIMFEIMPNEGDGLLQLIIGAENNEKVILSYGESRSSLSVVKDKTIPHLIPAGKWASYWLQIRRGEIMLGFDGISDPFFEWHYIDKKSLFEPIFMTYMSFEDNIIGVNFKCDECHAERTEIHRFTRIMPLGMWSKMDNTQYSNISFYLRGTGTVLIPLMLLPGAGEYYALTIGDYDTYILFVYNSKTDSKTLKAINLNRKPLQPNNWTLVTLSYSEKHIEVFYSNVSVLKYISEKPMLFYWFSVGAENGWVTWSTNCVPPDIDGAPRDGRWSKWSPWICSASCGGGTGYKTRTCSNPYPNIFGKLCEGPTKVTGKCNEFPCGDISPDTIKTIRDNLKTEKFSFVVDEGSKIVLEMNQDLFDVIKRESPTSYYEWTLNGLVLAHKQGQFEFSDDNVVIVNATVPQTGVYTCVLYRVNNKKLVLRVISVAVKPKDYSVVKRATYSFIFLSNAVVLGYIYTDLSQKWLLNDQIYIDYGITTLAAVDKKHIKSLSMSHSGMWQCVIEQKDLGHNWVTNIVNIHVKKAPTILTHLMEDEWSKSIFGRLPNETLVAVVLLVIILSVPLLVILCTIMWIRIRRRKIPNKGTFKRKRQTKKDVSK